MSRMFDTYKLPGIAIQEDCPKLSQLNLGNIRPLYNKNNQFYGVGVQHLMPFSLYFHLTEASDYQIDQLMSESSVEFNIYSKPVNKVLFSKVFLGKDVFNPCTQDIKIDLTKADVQIFNQESYSMELKLICENEQYIVYSKQDGLLVVR